MTYCRYVDEPEQLHIGWGWCRDKKKSRLHIRKRAVSQFKEVVEAVKKQKGKTRKKEKLTLKGEFMSRPNKSV
jgi:hypothetical protein